MSATRRLSIPNVLFLLRLCGVPLLLVLLHVEPLGWYVAWFVLLGVTDALNGFLVWPFPEYVRSNLAWLALETR